MQKCPNFKRRIYIYIRASNSYNFVVSEPIWTIPSALETEEKRASFYRDNLKVRDVKLKQKGK